MRLLPPEEKKEQAEEEQEESLVVCIRENRTDSSRGLLYLCDLTLIGNLNPDDYPDDWPDPKEFQKRMLAEYVIPTISVSPEEGTYLRRCGVDPPQVVEALLTIWI